MSPELRRPNQIFAIIFGGYVMLYRAARFWFSLSRITGQRFISGRIALDFGCGTGRSTRFLRDLSFHVLGVDIAAEMLERARCQDPGTDVTVRHAHHSLNLRRLAR